MAGGSLGRLVAQLTLPDPSPWTRRVSGPDGCERPGAATRVVLVPPHGARAHGWDRARALDAPGETLHLLGRGVTAEAPPFTPRGALVLVELDTCLPDDKGPVWPLALEAADAWLRAHLEGALAGLPAAEALWSSAMHRVLRPRVEALPLALGVAQRYGHAPIACSDPWPGAPFLEDALEGRTGSLDAPGPSALARRAFGARLVATTLAMTAGGIARRALEFRRQAPARAALRARRAASTGTPALWLTVTGQWPHSCRNVIESVGRDAAASGLPIGVLLQYALEPGALEGGLRAGGARGEIFPALSHPDLDGHVVAVDQIASAEGWRELAGIAASSARASARLALRLARRGPVFAHGGLRVDLASDTGDLPRLLSIDVLRTREAEAATERLVARRSFEGARVAFSHASLGPVCAPDLVLQRAGARTYDVIHGGLAEAMDMITNARTFSTEKLFWTHEEVRYTGPFLGARRVVGGVPCRRLGPPPGPPALLVDAPSVLVLSNYGVAQSYHDVEMPRIAYQRALFEALAGAVRTIPMRVRWRPHPGDDPAGVAAIERDFAVLGVEVSRGATLAEDLTGADVVLTSVSSTIVEALAYAAPIFVHAIPAHEAGVILAMFEPERRVCDAASLAAALGAHLALRARDPRASLAPEARLRARFFGPEGAPRTVLEAMGLAPAARAVQAATR